MEVQRNEVEREGVLVYEGVVPDGATQVTIEVLCEGPGGAMWLPMFAVDVEKLLALPTATSRRIGITFRGASPLMPPT